MKIHLVCLMAADLDYDILPHWIRHYKNLDIDTFTVFLHKEMSVKHIAMCSRLLMVNEFNIKTVSFKTGEYCEMLRSRVMTEFCKTIPKDEYILSVDSDEFQQWPLPIKECMLEGEIQMMEGELIDCFSGKGLTACVSNIPLEKQYPRQHKHLEQMLCEDENVKVFKKKKICCHLNVIPVDFYGSHEIKAGSDKSKSYTSRGVLPVHHYKWRATTKHRLLTKPYYTKENINTILAGFE